MTIYVKEAIARIIEKYGKLPSDELVRKLFEIGVIDHRLCKVLAVREFVAQQMKGGFGKVDAMFNASHRFTCTYEYVRKCVYYYTDVKL